MANLNKVMVIGNLTADPELRSTPSGTQVCELRLAVNRASGGQNGTERREEVTFLDVTCWARTAEIAAQYLRRGHSVFIEGRLQVDSWEDKTTGQKRSRTRIIAENLQLLTSKDGATAGGGNDQYGANKQGSQGGYGSQGSKYEQRGKGQRFGAQGSYQQPDGNEDIPF